MWSLPSTRIEKGRWKGLTPTLSKLQRRPLENLDLFSSTFDPFREVYFSYIVDRCNVRHTTFWSRSESRRVYFKQNAKQMVLDWAPTRLKVGQTLGGHLGEREVATSGVRKFAWLASRRLENFSAYDHSRSRSRIYCLHFSVARGRSFDVVSKKTSLGSRLQDARCINLTFRIDSKPKNSSARGRLLGRWPHAFKWRQGMQTVAVDFRALPPDYNAYRPFRGRIRVTHYHEACSHP